MVIAGNNKLEVQNVQFRNSHAFMRIQPSKEFDVKNKEDDMDNITVILWHTIIHL
jgi:hypothetical protein